MIGGTDFIVSTKGKFFEWEGYGLRLCVSEESLPTDMEECRINIKASLSGPFELPEDSELLSPVFWISTLCKFKKPVTLEIQHCACRDKAHFADLNFISTKCSQKELPYTFKQLDGGRFPTESSYGTIQLSHFSGITVTGRKRTPRAYCAQIYYTIKEEASDWRVYFIITKDLDTLKTVCSVHNYYDCAILPAMLLTNSALLQCIKQDYGRFAKWEDKFRISFREESSGISLDIPEDGEVTNKGWQILPHYNPSVSSKHYR